MSKADERVALITGGAQGIGEAVARRFRRDGISRLALVDRNAAAVAKTAKSFGSGDVISIAADLTSVAACKDAVAQVIGRFGRIDILANCAGCTERGGVADTDEALFERMFAVNVRAPFFLIQAAAADMKTRRSGIVINIASMLAYGGPPILAAYSMSKSALVTLTKTAANTLRFDGVRVFAINLGWAVTPQEQMVQTRVHGMPVDWAEEIGAKMPFGRLLLPDDAAGLCSFLISKDAAMMTGAVIDLEQWVAGTMESHPVDKSPAET
jgi:NAD(P)-dependent dehydrogenase (short-subunit alcohol dehydrogenase family)